jgi:hypothetical protein
MEAKMPMQKISGNVYSVFLEVLLWLLPIAGLIAGFVLGDDTKVLAAAGGVITGILVGALIGGPLVLLLNIRASLFQSTRSPGARQRPVGFNPAANLLARLGA